jgi:cytochrome c-type biogenesis protein CcmF
MTFVLVATTFPLISEWISGQTVTVGPPFYNKWMAPIGLVIFALMGLAPLFGWTKTSGASLRKAFLFPGLVTLVVTALHLGLGARLGYPFRVAPESFDGSFGEKIFLALSSLFPGVTVSLSAFNIAVILQEYARGLSARRSSAVKAGSPEGFFEALVQLIARARRRYGGYIVHLGITAMFLGFVGTAWRIEREVSLLPGQSHDVAGYHIVYEGTRMCPGNPRCSSEENQAKGRRMLFADLRIERGGRTLTKLSPAKFIYQSPPQTTSEVGLLRGLRDDLYAVLATADPETKKATFSFHVNPFVSWIWLGLLTLIGGCAVSLWPEVGPARSRSYVWVRGMTAATATILFSFYVALSAAQPYSATVTKTLSGAAPSGSAR